MLINLKELKRQYELLISERRIKKISEDLGIKYTSLWKAVNMMVEQQDYILAKLIDSGYLTGEIYHEVWRVKKKDYFSKRKLIVSASRNSTHTRFAIRRDVSSSEFFDVQKVLNRFGLRCYVNTSGKRVLVKPSERWDGRYTRMVDFEYDFSIETRVLKRARLLAQ